MGSNKDRPDQNGPHRLAFEHNKKRILATQNVCGICGGIVDKSLRYPHPQSAVIDHVIPISRGGHPSDIDNLQLAHWCCNRQKADKLIPESGGTVPAPNRDLPLSTDWTAYRGR